MREIDRACDLVRKYNKMTGKSIKINIAIWQFENIPGVQVDMSLTSVDPSTYECVCVSNMSLKGIADFINSKEILFRKFI